MVRPSYYQNAGNPLQKHLLPRYALPFEFPVFGESLDANSMIRNSVLWNLLMIDVVSTVVILFFSNVMTPELLLSFGLIYAMTGCVISKGTVRTYFAALAAILMGLLLSWSIGNSPFISLPILACLLSYYIYQFGTHWIYRCTPSPLPRSQAARLRSRHQTPLLILSITPVLAAGAALAFQSGWMFSGTLLLVSLIQFFSTSNRWKALRYAKAALTSWSAYNTNHVEMPGIMQSPVGSAADRRLILLTSAGGFAFLCGTVNFTEVGGHGNLITLLFFPAFFFALVPMGILLPLLGEVVSIRHEVSKTNHWSDLVDECRNSTNPVVRDSFYMGQVAADGSPLIVHRKTFEAHAHFVGPTGGGKTSKGLCPWIEQTIRHGDSSVIVLDLKADSLELLASLAAGADELKQRTGTDIPLKVFSSMAHLPTHTFNPLSQSLWKNLELNQKTDIICAALGLNYGTDYGAGYYSSANAAIVYEALRMFPNIRSLRELAEQCRFLIQPTTKSELHKEIKKDGVHVCEEIKRLAAFEQLQVSPPKHGSDPIAEEAIDLASLFQTPQLLYVHLSSTLGASSAPAIARLFTYFLLASATQVDRKCRVHLVIDEFQRMASKSLEYLLQLARSMDIGVILSNQSMEDLKTLKSNLIPAIEANCQYRQWFDVGSTEDLERIMKVSGERVEWLSSKSVSVNSNGSSETSGMSEHILPRLSINEIMTAGSSVDLSIERIGRDDGYAQYGRFPFIAYSAFHISEAEYQRRRAFSWPKQTPGMMIPKGKQGPQQPAAPRGPGIVQEIDGREAESPNKAPGPLENLFETLERPPQKRRKKKSDDDSGQKPEGDDDSTK